MIRTKRAWKNINNNSNYNIVIIFSNSFDLSTISISVLCANNILNVFTYTHREKERWYHCDSHCTEFIWNFVLQTACHYCVCVCDCVWTYAPNRKTESLSGDSVEHDSETKREEKRAVTTNGILCFLI